MADNQSAKRGAGQACETGKGGIMKCLNLKVIAGLAALGLGIWALAPGLALAAAPFLLFLACPISMWLMMRGMNGSSQSEPAAGDRVSTNASVAGESLPELKARLARLDAEQEAIARAVSRQETGSRVQSGQEEEASTDR